MTSYNQMKHDLVQSGFKYKGDLYLTMQDGSLRLIRTDNMRGHGKIAKNMRVYKCDKVCSRGPDEDGMCQMGKKSLPRVPCQGQFWILREHRQLHGKGERYAQIELKRSEAIEKVTSTMIRLANGTVFNWDDVQFIGGAKLAVGKFMVPCGNICAHRGGNCIKRGHQDQPCAQQFYYVRQKHHLNPPRTR